MHNALWYCFDCARSMFYHLRAGRLPAFRTPILFPLPYPCWRGWPGLKTITRPGFFLILGTPGAGAVIVPTPGTPWECPKNDPSARLPRVLKKKPDPVLVPHRVHFSSSLALGATPRSKFSPSALRYRPLVVGWLALQEPKFLSSAFAGQIKMKKKRRDRFNVCSSAGRIGSVVPVDASGPTNCCQALFFLRGNSTFRYFNL